MGDNLAKKRMGLQTVRLENPPATVLNGYILDEMKKKNLNRVLFMATGALHSTLATQQGESIPCIAHAITIDNNKDG